MTWRLPSWRRSVDKGVLARELAIRSLVIQGASREWAEAHVEDAELNGDQLSYRTRLDNPVHRLHGVFTVEQEEEGNDHADEP